MGDAVMLFNVASTRVFKSEHVALTYDDGRPRLFQLAPDFTSDPLWLVPLFAPPAKPAPPTRWCVLVHPDRWDAFWMAVNQPDVFAHPDVQRLLGLGRLEPTAPPPSTPTP